MTDLRPVGMVDFNGKRMEVRASMDWIRKGEQVMVERMNGREVVVKRSEIA